MKFTSILVKDIKRLRYVFIVPKSNVVKIAGKNAQGKTSVLDCFGMLIEGERAIPATAKRDGCKKAKIIGTLDAPEGPITVSRRLSEKGTLLELVDAKGTPLPGMQWLKKIVAAGSMDVMNILKKKPQERRSLLLKMVGVDVDGIDKRYKGAFEERTICNRQRDNEAAKLRAISPVQGAPDKEVNYQDALNELSTARTHNERLEEMKNTRAGLEMDKGRLLKDLEVIKAKIAAAEERIQNIDIQSVGEELVDLAPLNLKLKKIEEINTGVRANASYRAAVAAAESAEADCEKAEKAVTAIDEEKKALLAGAKWPIPGMSVGGDDIMLNDKPFEEASGRERLLAMVAITAHLIPKDGLRALRADDGEKLDASGWTELRELADRLDVQVWITCVQDRPDTSDASEIYIEDGVVMGQEAATDADQEKLGLA